MEACESHASLSTCASLCSFPHPLLLLQPGILVEELSAELDVEDVGLGEAMCEIFQYQHLPQRVSALHSAAEERGMGLSPTE